MTCLMTIKETHLNDLKNAIKDLNLGNNDWDSYDDGCKTATLNKSDTLIDSINRCLNPENKIQDKNNVTLHYIKYTIKELYEIQEHNDACQKTILIYLEKDPTIQDIFYVNGNLINNSKWLYRSLIMDGQLEHGGKFLGNGNRTILGIFVN